MQITARTLLASVAASAVLGGAVGALATAASTSQASPQAIAAAVQKVSDPSAERALRLIAVRSGTWEEIASSAKEATALIQQVETTANEIRRETHNTCVVSARFASEAAGC
jgi:hypothetical protein